jgi:hypothetical protein
VRPLDKELRDILEGRNYNHILPFLWMHGEDEEIIRNELQQIHLSGIGAVCVESRPHPDFAGPGWWHDMDIVMDEAKKLNMKVWVLDDAHFPTGYANGWIKEKFPEKGKRYLNEIHVDVCGPLNNASIAIDGWLNRTNFMDPNAISRKDDKLITVAAAERSPEGGYIPGQLIELMTEVKDGFLRWNIPEGSWRVFIIYTTSNGGGNTDYINPIDAYSVRVLIDAVYEPHFNHYGKDFGTTFAGFFSDEPGMGNTAAYNFDESIGRKKMPLPWSEWVPQLLEAELGGDYLRLLPCLWYDADEAAALIRLKYMDAITGLYEKCFSRQLGDWCRSRGVEYIGHVIEDQNVHTRLGAGAGHFFRALAGQDMSGVDVVIRQILPGFDSIGPSYFGGEWDGEFFHFGLAKLAVSASHIDPLKNGRTMCEIFGAYGWSEGLKLMKWLVDHMLVRGVNHMVPHAFSPKEYPDFDCPPHFYARGRNPQFRYFSVLMNYTNRLCHLFNGGIHVAPAAILYHAEAEWTGDYTPFHKPAAVLCRSQIDYDIIPADVFDASKGYNTEIHGSKLSVNGEEYSCLVIPGSEYITTHIAELLTDTEDNCIEAVFVDRYPEAIAEKTSAESERLIKELKKYPVIRLEDLETYLHATGNYEVSTEEKCGYLRYYHYKKAEADIFMFFNEDPYVEINTKINVPIKGNPFIYDAFNNCVSLAEAEMNGEMIRVTLKLSPYESKILIWGDIDKELAGPELDCSDLQNELPKEKTGETISLNLEWKLLLASAEDYPEFSFKKKLGSLQDLSLPNLYPEFSGTMRYEAAFDLKKTAGKTVLNLGEVYETAEVWINDKKAGIRICPPYCFDISALLEHGSNMLRIDVTNTLVREQTDMLSMFSAIEPTGLIGPVTINLPD